MFGRRLFAAVSTIALTVGIFTTQGTAASAQSAGTNRIVSSVGSQFEVLEADSSAAGRLESQYPNRLRRVPTAPKALQLNNVSVMLPKVVTAGLSTAAAAALGAATLPASGPCANKQVASPNDAFILVCVDKANTLDERDRRALLAFINFASRESQPLAAHVSSELEWEALEKVLHAQNDGSQGVRFREVRYGDGLSPGLIKIQRLQVAP